MPSEYEIGLTTKEGFTNSLRVIALPTLFLIVITVILLIMRVERGIVITLLEIDLSLLFVSILLGPRRFTFYTEMQRNLRAARIRTNF